MTTIPAFLLQDDAVPSAAAGAVAGIFGLGFLLVMMAIWLVFIIAMWKVFVKAGQPGWAAIIPIYNAYILTKIAGRPGWWVLLLLIPFVGLVIGIILCIDIAKSYGQSPVFAVLMLIGGIGFLVLGFGSARYVGPAAATA